MSAMVRTIALALVSATILFGSGVPVLANSMVIDGPGFKVEKRKGWFGRKSTSYQDALGNKVENSTGFFGRKRTETSVLGSQMVKQGNNVTVKNSSGKPLVTTRKTWLGGKQTHIDGYGIINSFGDLFSNP